MSLVRILTVPLSEAKENRQDLRWHRGDLAATTVGSRNCSAAPPEMLPCSLRSLAAWTFLNK
jgi:hypothetical protein